MRSSAARVGVTAAWAALALVAAAVALLAVAADTSAATRTTRTVAVGDFFYTPKLVHAKVGHTVRFVNRGRIGHTVADVSARGSIVGRAIRPRLLETGDVQVVTLRRAGTIRQ